MHSFLVSPSPVSPVATIAVIGGGPAGLMAAEALAARGVRVVVFDAMPSVGRKFLMAGRGGLNLTHTEPAADFLARYGSRQADLAPMLDQFDAQAVRAWTHALGVETFVGSSGRVFPTDMKAAPLLRSWLHRLRAGGVEFRMRYRWTGWAGAAGDPLALSFDTPAGTCTVRPDAVVLALGGGSWPRLGSDGAWSAWLSARGVPVQPLRPANCGFDAAWSAHFSTRYAGQPVKSVAIAVPDVAAPGNAPEALAWRRGECMITVGGIEGSLIYAMSAAIRTQIETQGMAEIYLDLLPDQAPAHVRHEVARPRGARSLSSHLQSRLGLTGVKAGLLRECLSREAMHDPAHLGAAIKALPVRLVNVRPLAEAISSAGGVPFEALTPGLMIESLPGVFCAGEMLDWEAPTGGYLLTACFASGLAAARGALDYIEAQNAAREA